MKRTTTLAATVLLLGIGLAACGDDKKDSSTGTGSDNDKIAAAVAKYCDDSLAAETLPDPDIDDEAPEAEQMAAAKKFLEEDLKPIIDRLRTSVPAEVKAPTQVLFAAFDQVTVDGDFSKLETPEVAAAEAQTHAYDLANCGWNKVDVTAAEYSFQGIPATLEQGTTSFELTNGGKELHEMTVLKKKEGVTETFDELLKIEDEAEAKKKVDEVASTFTPQGKTDHAVGELEAGEYIVLCFIPVGTTSQEAAPPENSPPHFTQGMKAEFKVT